MFLKLVSKSAPALRQFSRAPLRSLNASGVRFCTTSSGGGEGSKRKTPIELVPEDFFDEDAETEREFFDMITSMSSESGLENLTSSKETMTWEEIEEAGDSNSHPYMEELITANDPNAEGGGGSNSGSNDLYDSDFMESMSDNPAVQKISRAFENEDLADHLDGISKNGAYVPPEFLNYTVPWRNTDEHPEPELQKFLPDTSEDHFMHDNHGRRACAGKKQRRGQAGELHCHLLDLDTLNHFDVLTLRRFLSADSEIMGRKETKLCAKCQRKVAKTIKRARNLGILGHIDEFIVQDSLPLQREGTYHVQVDKTINAGVARTIL